MNDDDWDFSDDEERPSFKKISKNEQIYGDFFEAYEYEEKKVSPLQFEKPAEEKHTSGYERFKAGSTIESYIAEVEVNIPKRRYEQQEPIAPKIGAFSLASFMQTNNDLEVIEEDNLEEFEEGLNNRTIMHLCLTKATEDEEEEEREMYQYLGYKYQYQNAEEREKAKQLRQSYGAGFNILEKMGYKVNRGLGKMEDGMAVPVAAVSCKTLNRKDEEEKIEEESEIEENLHEKILEKLSEYRSKNKKIDEFLRMIKLTYDKTNAEYSRVISEIESREKELELTECFLVQKILEKDILEDEINKLENLKQSLLLNTPLPSLALKYKLDSVLVKQTIDKIHAAEHQPNAFKLIANALNSLNSELKEMYINKNMEHIKNYNNEIIECSLTDEDEKTIHEYITIVVDSKVNVILEAYFRNRNTLSECFSEGLMELLQLLKRLNIVQKISSQHIVKKVNEYLKSIKIKEYLHMRNGELAPHLVVFPWLPVLPLTELALADYFNGVILSTPTEVDESVLQAVSTIMKPFLRFAAADLTHFAVYFYMVPLLLRTLDHFTLDYSSQESSMNYLKILSEWKGLFSIEIMIELLQCTIMLKLTKAYRSVKNAEEKDLRSWLEKWKNIVDELAKGVFIKGFKMHGVEIGQYFEE